MSDEDDPTTDPAVKEAETLVDSIVAAYDRGMLSVVAATVSGVEVQVLCIAFDATSIYPAAVLMNDALIPQVHPHDMQVTDTQPKETDGE